MTDLCFKLWKQEDLNVTDMTENMFVLIAATLIGSQRSSGRDLSCSKLNK